MNDEPSMLKTLFWIVFIPIAIVGFLIPRKENESWLVRGFKVVAATAVIYSLLIIVLLGAGA